MKIKTGDLVRKTYTGAGGVATGVVISENMKNCEHFRLFFTDCSLRSLIGLAFDLTANFSDSIEVWTAKGWVQVEI